MSERQTVLGIGGVFFKCKDPAALGAWYQKHLGLKVMDFGGAHGAMFPLGGSSGSGDGGYQLWTAFPHATQKFAEGQTTMLNFRVADLNALLAQLRADGVSVEDKVDRSDYGDFGWIIDGEGNRVELWQPPKE